MLRTKLILVATLVAPIVVGGTTLRAQSGAEASVGGASKAAPNGTRVRTGTTSNDAFVKRIDHGPKWLTTWMACAKAAPSPKATRPCSAKMIAGQMHRVMSLQETPDKSVLAALHYGGKKSRLSFYDVKTKANVGGSTISGMALRNAQIAFSPDGAFVVLGMPNGKEHVDGRIVLDKGGVTTIVNVSTGKKCESRATDARFTYWQGATLVAVGWDENGQRFETVKFNRKTCGVVSRAPSISKAAETKQAKSGARLTAAEPPVANQWYYSWDAALKTSASIGPTKSGVAVKCGGRTHRLKMHSDVIKLFDDGTRAAVGQKDGIDIVSCAAK